MIHFLPIADQASPIRSDWEPLGRIAGLRRALRLIDDHGGGPAPDLDDLGTGAIAASARRCFDVRSERAIGAATAGLDAVVAGRAMGVEPSSAAMQALAREIRAGLADLSSLLR